MNRLRDSCWIFLFGLALTVCLLGGRIAFAQRSQNEKSAQFVASQVAGEKTEQPESRPTKSASPKSTAGKADSTKSEVKSVPLPKDATIEQFLEWLQNRKGPAFAVNSIELDGSANDDRAELTATITIQILRSDGWVVVPLYLNEAVIGRDWKHEFLGDRVDGKANETGGKAALKDLTQEAGYRWWFRGEGYHRLRLPVVVPVTKSVGRRRVRLSLPPLSASSTLQLRVPVSKLKAAELSAPQGVDSRVTPAGKNASRIQLTGIGALLDLQWRSTPVRTTGKPFLQAETSILVGPKDDSIVLTAVQRVQALRGSVQQIKVQLPAGYQAVGATGKYVANYQVDTKNLATVDLSEPRTMLTEIKWTLERRFPIQGGRLTLDGFQVQDARVQSGEIVIEKVQGLRVEKADSGNRAVHRIRTVEVLASELVRDIPVAGAFRFLRQPFRLNLDVSRQPSHITVEPNIVLSIADGEVTLVGDFQVQVSDDGGLVDAVEIDWPTMKEGGWTLLPLESSTFIETRTVRQRGDVTVLHFQLAGRRGGRFSIPITARRKLPMDGRLSFHVPQAKANVNQPTTLHVMRQPNIEVELVDDRGAPLLIAPGSPSGPLADQYRIDPDTGALFARVVRHTQRLRADSRVVVTPQPRGLTMRQKFLLKIEYEPVDVIAVRIPSSLRDSIRFFQDNNQALPTKLSASPTEDSLVIELSNLPKRGNVEFFAEYFVPLPAELTPGASRSVLAPLAAWTAASFSELQVRVEERSPIDISISAEEWSRFSTIDALKAWSSKSSPTAVPLELSYPEIPSTRRFAISRALIRANVGSGGEVKYRAQYRLPRGGRDVHVLLPQGVRFVAAWEDTHRIEQSIDTRSVRDGRTMYRIPLADRTSPPGRKETLLTIDYQAEGATALHWLTDRTLVAPEFPGNVRIEETAWQLTLPPNQHLASYDQEHFGEFRWRPVHVVWTRQPTLPFDRTEEWIGSDTGPPNMQEPGNVYYFRRFGPDSTLQIGSASRSVALLIGAGIAWLFGILLVKVSRLRSTFTFLTVALVAAILALWYPTQLQLLVQPMLIGVFLAVGFVAIERAVKRRRTAPIITAANPNEFVLNASATSSIESRERVYAGSEDPTAHRAPDQHAVSSPSSAIGTEG